MIGKPVWKFAAAAGAAVGLAFFGGAATAQDDGESLAGALTVSMSDDLAEAMAEGGVSLEDFIAGLTLTAGGEEPVRTYLVAARYDDDRMVRYEVSEPVLLEPGVATAISEESVILHALGPRTEHGVALSTPNPEVVPLDIQPPVAGFVGSMPANTLTGVLDPSAPALDYEARKALGSVGVIAPVPADAAVRDAGEMTLNALAVRLDYED